METNHFSTFNSSSNSNSSSSSNNNNNNNNSNNINTVSQHKCKNTIKPIIDYVKLQKILFIYNAIQSGWTVKNVRGKYIFTKKHHNKKEYFYDTYLKEFIESNIDSTLEATSNVSEKKKTII